MDNLADPADGIDEHSALVMAALDVARAPPEGAARLSAWLGKATAPSAHCGWKEEVGG